MNGTGGERRSFQRFGHQVLTGNSVCRIGRRRCPVLAFFGENDIVQPSETSARLFEEYLTAAGNDDFTIVTMPGVGHDINWTTPGYSEQVSEWLNGRA